MTSASYRTDINVDLPDNPLARVLFTLETELAAANDEVFPYLRTYRLLLDGNGRGTIELPTPDNTGEAAWSWYVYLPASGPYLVNIAYDADAQELADLLDDVALSLPAAAALLSTKANTVAGTAGNLAQLIGDGHLEDSDLAAADVLALLLPTTCYCAMSIAVAIPPNQEVLMPMQVLGQTAAIHPGGIAGTLSVVTHGLYDFQATVYTETVSLDGYYIDAKLRKNQETDNAIVGWNRKGGLPTASVVQVLPVLAPAVNMAADDTIELYLSHNFTEPIDFFVERFVLRRNGDYA